jgi:hypothetical protein
MNPEASEFGILVASAGNRFARWYDDGPDYSRSDGSDPAEVESAYREGFLEGARNAAGWREPESRAVEDAESQRRRTKRRAELVVEWPARSGSTVIAYKLGHAVSAARARGFFQALATAFDAWFRLVDAGLDDDQITAALLPAWLDEVVAWADAPIGQAIVACPPVLDETEAARSAQVAAVEGTEQPPLQPRHWLSVRDLLSNHPDLRPPVIDRLLRQGETMNVIAPPKTGKSWLVNDLAIAVATGRPWLGRYETRAGGVLIIDNELHPETSANRIPTVAAARGAPLAEFADSLHVCNMRGSLKDLDGLAPVLDTIEAGQFRVIILDAWYRFMPADTDENDNGSMARLYNRLDLHAQRIGCCFVLIHHSTKGSQSAKAVTDVGAGAGAQSRATDTHLVLRQHEEADAVVLDAAVRSWPRIDPVCLRWAFPVWEIDDDLDPALLARPTGRRRSREREAKQAAPKPEPWTPERFVREFVSLTPRLRDEIVLAAQAADLSKAQANSLLRIAETNGLLHRWQQGHHDPVRFSTEPQPVTEEAE